MIISFSGIDGSGKSSTIDLVKKNFKKSKVIFFNKYIFLDVILNFLKFFYKKKNLDKKKNILLLKKNKFFLFKLWPLIVILDNYLFYFYIKFFSIMGYHVFCDRYFIDKIVSYNLHGFSNKFCNKIYMFLYINSDIHFYLRTNLKIAKNRETGNNHNDEFFDKINSLYEMFHSEIKDDYHEVFTNSDQKLVCNEIMQKIFQKR